MGFVRIDDHGGVLGAWSSVAPAGKVFQNVEERPQAFTHLSYDHGRDVIILSNGVAGASNNYYDNDALDAAEYYSALDLTHTAIKGPSLNPAGALEVVGQSRFRFPISGTALWFTVDHSSGKLYGCIHALFKEQPRQSGAFFTDYGNVMMWTYTLVPSGPSTIYVQVETLGTQAIPDGLNAQTIQLAAFTQAGKPIALKPDHGSIMVAPVVMGDVAAYAYGQGTYYGAYIALHKTDAAHTWVASRPIGLSFVFGLAPIGIDQFILFGHVGTDAFTIGGQTAEVAALTYRYNRISGRLELDDASIIPTSYVYRWPDHVGYMTYDSRRQAIILLSPDGTTFERYSYDRLCHPISPNILGTPAPVRPLHAGRQTTFAALGQKNIQPVGGINLKVQYGGSTTSAYDQQPAEVRLGAIDGIGTFTVGLTSVASSASLSIQLFYSGFSVAVSSTTTHGSAYGVTHLSLTSVSAAFVVSATLSASVSATSLVTGATILAKRPVKETDAGGGTPRELDHPLSGTYPSPLVYPWSPPVWTGMLDIPLKHPLYASQRTLEKTATVQFSGDVTDVEVVETWPGGGNRIAMPLSFFSSLWDYYANPPDFVSQGFILWRPRDVSARVYQVIITGLTVGGAGGGGGGEHAITLDHLAKQGDGFIHDTVTVRLRLVSEVSAT